MPAAGPRPSASRTATLSVARAPKMPKYSGSTTRRAPLAAAAPISGLRRRKIRGDIAARYHLHGGDAKRQPFSGRHPLQWRLARAAPYRHRVIPSAFGPGATLAVAVPPRVTTGSDQPPVTVY